MVPRRIGKRDQLNASVRPGRLSLFLMDGGIWWSTWRSPLLSHRTMLAGLVLLYLNFCTNLRSLNIFFRVKFNFPWTAKLVEYSSFESVERWVLKRVTCQLIIRNMNNAVINYLLTLLNNHCTLKSTWPKKLSSFGLQVSIEIGVIIEKMGKEMQRFTIRQVDTIW